VSPVIAVVLGALVLGERLGPLEWLGGAAMLGAAALVLPGRAAGTRRRRGVKKQANDS
jgi:drug/metabolite transporter (DMT)-like permease